MNDAKVKAHAPLKVLLRMHRHAKGVVVINGIDYSAHVTAVKVVGSVDDLTTLTVTLTDCEINIDHDVEQAAY